MDIPLKMPDLATTGGAIKVVRWLVEPGRKVRRGEPLLEVETDKAVMPVEAASAGRLKALVAVEGAEIDAGQTIAILEGEPAEPPPRMSFFSRNRQSRAKGKPTSTAPRPPALALSIPQKVAARRLAESQRTVPHFYLQTSANAGPMAARRAAAKDDPLTWDAFFVHAAGKALRAFERMRCRYEDDHLIPAPEAIGVAVDLDGDLFTLVVDDPAGKSVEAISREIEARAARLRAGDPQARMSRAARLTISNLGGSGIESFAAVINPPESAILAVGKVMPVVTVVEGQVAVQQRVNLTLSVDHRVASGKYAAGFLGAIVSALESIEASPHE
jgi:pyruvate dehydrogenase E2 component (dihydrolipoamide acetyltransferase)